MPSPEHAADLERVLARAAKECEGVAAWFGDGLPAALQRALDAAGRAPADGAPEVAFVDVREISEAPAHKHGLRRIVVLSDGPLSELNSLVRTAEASTIPSLRLVCPFAVFDLAREGLRVREIQRGLTAADLQAHLDTPLWAGPDLQEL